MDMRRLFVLILLLVAGLSAGCLRRGRPSPPTPTALPATEVSTALSSAPAPGPGSAVPLLADVEPLDGAELHGTEAWVRWRPSGAGQGRVYWRTVGSEEFQPVEAERSEYFAARLGPLEPGGAYEYIVEEQEEALVLRTEMRTFSVTGGIAFEQPTVEQTIARDYNQSVMLTLRNDSAEPVLVAAHSLAQYDDLPADIVGPGSFSEPVELPAGASLPLRLAVTAPDATRDTYEFPIEAAGAFALARVHIDQPEFKLSLKVIEENPQTLAKTIEIHNEGDELTDLSVRIAPPGDAEARLYPGASHSLLPVSGALQFVVEPILYLEFESLALEIEASAAGQAVRFPLEFKAPEAKRLIGIRTGTQERTSSYDFYCTNKPTTCSELPGPTAYGPLLASIGSFFSTGPGECELECNVAEACQTAAALEEYIKNTLDVTGPHEGLGGRHDFDTVTLSPQQWNQFRGRVDNLLNKLSNTDLACRFNEASDAGGISDTLGELLRERNSLEELDLISIRRDDLESIDRMLHHLDALQSLLACPGAGETVAEDDNPCPDVGSVGDIKTKLDRALKVAEAGAQATGDQQAKRVLEQTAKALKYITKALGWIKKLGGACELLRDFLQAIETINNAGCDPAQLAKGFDDLFRTAGKVGSSLPPPASWYFQLLAQNQGFFTNTSGALNPEQRWADQFEGVEGYIPGGCP